MYGVTMMSKRLVLLIAPVLLLMSALVFAQDITNGTILAFDRQANVIVFTDKTVWHLEKLESAVPGNLKAGERIDNNYESNEDEGVTVIHSVKVLSQ